MKLKAVTEARHHSGNPLIVGVEIPEELFNQLIAKWDITDQQCLEGLKHYCEGMLAADDMIDESFYEWEEFERR